MSREFDKKVTVRMSAEMVRDVEIHMATMKEYHGITLTFADAVRHLVHTGIVLQDE